MLNTPPHLEARDPRGFVSIFHGTSSSVARRRLRASDLSFWQSMPSFDIGRPGLHLQSGASVVFGWCGRAAREPLHRFQSTRPVWGATCLRCDLCSARAISIHAPRVGRDRMRTSTCWADTGFQSTRPVWGATAFAVFSALASTFQSTRPVWGATCRRHAQVGAKIFQSTRPVWGATRKARCKNSGAAISIHTPRVGRDLVAGKYLGIGGHFNPHAPCGARPACQR